MFARDKKNALFLKSYKCQFLKPDFLVKYKSLHLINDHTIYRGGLDQNGKPHGEGVCQYPKSLFEGTWDHGEKIEGLYKDRKGSIIEGFWLENRPYGKCT